MKEQLTKLEEIFVAQFMLATGDQLNSIASVRYSFASRLYYRTLFSLLKQVICADIFFEMFSLKMYRLAN